jgi:hypothetical protein
VPYYFTHYVLVFIFPICCCEFLQVSIYAHYIISNVSQFYPPSLLGNYIKVPRCQWEASLLACRLFPPNFKLPIRSIFNFLYPIVEGKKKKKNKCLSGKILLAMVAYNISHLNNFPFFNKLVREFILPNNKSLCLFLSDHCTCCPSEDMQTLHHSFYV